MHDKRLIGYTAKVPSSLGSVYVTLNFARESLNKRLIPKQLLITIGKSGGELQALVQAIYLLFNKGLEQSIPIEELTKELRHISSDRAIGKHGYHVKSVPDAIAQAIEEIMTRKGPAPK